ncbi:hypothetical protein OG792_19520 [Micromonospora sp. NBC_01699]|uniref:hypothetical protein n=1 Tax=Micromonospora sp. NBC_01699 TaxID=2975984 RepID=UPI002E2D4F16|nr:hypothetical protein [Micromonospora sp. NBC_01699]
MGWKMIRIRIFALVCLSALVLTGCANGGADDGQAPADTGSTSAPTSDGDASAAPPAGGLSATELCDYLRGELPRLKDVGSEVGAMAQLAIGLAGWFEQQGSKPRDGAEMDELTEKECPQVRTDVLTTIGKASFSEL